MCNKKWKVIFNKEDINGCVYENVRIKYMLLDIVFNVGWK